MKRLGLRSEIVLQLGLLMAAALLLSSILILKFYEQEMLQQQIDSAITQLRLISHSVEPDARDQAPSELQRSIGPSSLQALFLQIGDSSPRPLFVLSGGKNLNSENLRKSGITGQSLVSLETSRHYLWWELPRLLEVTVPLNDRIPYGGSLQGIFSMDKLADQIASLHETILFIVLLFGLILTLFGSYLLGKNVVKPVLSLEEASRRVTDGDLEQRLSINGSRTLVSLADSFNQMIAALRKARTSREDHIAELEQLNQQLKRTQNDLVQAEKMSSIGHLSAGMAHEIGNPLGALIGYLELLRKSSDTGEKDIGELALTEAGRIDQLVRDLLDYARPVMDDEPCSEVGRVIEASCRILVQQGACLEERFQLSMKTPPLNVLAPPNRLQQVMINLLRNALDASPQDTQIRVSAEQEEGQVKIRVSNPCEPISEDILGSMFDPFFTTKGPDKGRGLGLFVCHNIIHDAGGSISAETNNGRIIFVVTLPGTGGAHVAT